MQLTKVEGRVIGSLIEKELTTPQQYPLSLNALVLACNQSSNRDPVVDYDEATVSRALASLKISGLVRFVHPSHGRSVTRYEQLLADQAGMDRGQLALIGVLLLRGPQTAGELRTRVERMCDLDDIAAVEEQLLGLSQRPEPAVTRLSRRPGQKEERWAELLTVTDSPGVDRPDGAAASGGGGPDATAGTSDSRLEGAGDKSVHNELEVLRSEVAELRGAFSDLSTTVAGLRDELRALYDELH